MLATSYQAVLQICHWSNSQVVLYSVRWAQFYRHCLPELPCMLAHEQATVRVVSDTEVDMLSHEQATVRVVSDSEVDMLSW